MHAHVSRLISLSLLFLRPHPQVLSAVLQPDDLVQFGGAAGLKPGETLALPPSAANEQGGGAAVVVGGSGNGVVYRFVERQVVQQQQQQQGRKKGGGGGGGKKRAAAAPLPASAASLVAASLVPAAVDGNGHGSNGNNNKRRKVEPKEQEGGEEEEVGKLREEVKQLRAALVGATQGAEGIFKVRVCIALTAHGLSSALSLLLAPCFPPFSPCIPSNTFHHTTCIPYIKP